MGVARVQELFIPLGFIAQEEQALGIGVEAADGIDIARKTEFRQRAVGRAVTGELAKHPVRFVEGDEHGQLTAVAGWDLYLANAFSRHR